MPRSDIHPSLCRFHAEREDQLFGDPAPSGVVGAGLDLPELYSACRDLTTAAGVNRALGQVFRLLAQRRISRQEAATFCHLAQLLLRSISAMRAERAEAQCDLASGSPFKQISEAAASSVDSKPTDAHRLFAQCSGQSNSPRAGAILESVSTAEPAALAKDVNPSPPGSPSHAVVACDGAKPSPARFAADSAARRARNPSVVWHTPASAPPLDPEIGREEALHSAGSQLAPNDHLQNCGT